MSKPKIKLIENPFFPHRKIEAEALVWIIELIAEAEDGTEDFPMSKGTEFLNIVNARLSRKDRKRFTKAAIRFHGME